MYDIRLSRKSTFILLFIFCIIGFTLRMIYFDRMTFGYDQARDGFEAVKIWHGNPIKIIGPMTDIPGLYHGTVYWYLISPFLVLSAGNIYVVRLLLILLNLVGVPLTYVVGKKMFKNAFVGLVSSFLFATSIEAIQYARWVSNPSPAILTTLLTYFGFYLILKRSKWGIPLVLISWPLSVNFEFFLAYHIFFLVPLVIWVFIRDKKLPTSNKLLACSVGISLALFSPFIVAELKFGQRGIRGLLTYIAIHGKTGPSVIEKMQAIGIKLYETFYYNGFTSANIVTYGFIIIVVASSIYIAVRVPQLSGRMKFIYFWLLSPLILYLFGSFNSFFIRLGNLYAVLFLVAFVLSYGYRRFRYRILATIFLAIYFIISSGLYVFSNNQYGEAIFTVQRRMMLQDELRVLDWVYKESGGKEFAYNTVTNPLLVNTTWSYLFNWYGLGKYHYKPAWIGYPQVGVYGAEVIYPTLSKRQGTPFFLIIEPKPGIPDEYVRGYEQFENTRSRLIITKKIGTYVVEKRVLTNGKYFSTDELYAIVKDRP